uniref:Putative secreted protein n=1 Tax=Anopheles marajoara TaxID=58244 RepID=A0A2M4CDY1_9DIPT
MCSGSMASAVALVATTTTTGTITCRGRCGGAGVGSGRCGLQDEVQLRTDRVESLSFGIERCIDLRPQLFLAGF